MAVIYTMDAVYKKLLDTSSVAMLIFQVSPQAIVEANTPALRLYGYSRAEFLSLKLADFSAERDATVFYDFLSKNSRDGCESEWLHKRKDGSRVLISIRCHEIWYQKRRCTFVIMEEKTQDSSDLRSLARRSST